MVWDVYLPDSLKGTTRQKRGKGVRRRVSPSTTIPKSWKDFIRVDDNKTELFKFLAQHVTCLTVNEGKVLYATSAQDVLSSTCLAELSNLTPCSQEEADTRLILHAADAVAQGKRRVSVRTVDTDVVVLAATFFSQMKPDEMWIAFSTGKNFRFIPIHEIVSSLTPKICSSLLAFHAFTGCDTLSSFGGREKTAWETWKVFPEVSDPFLEMTNIFGGEISDACMILLKRFVVLMCDRTSECLEVNEARKQLFIKKSRTLETIPPTKAALEQHIKPASYQARCWSQALVQNPQLPSPSDWGWIKKEGEWHSIWTTLVEAAKSYHELICCKCKQGFIRRCKCVKAELKCTALCLCLGDCSN